MTNQIDPVAMASQFVQIDRAREDRQLQRRESDINAMDRALESLEDNLKDIEAFTDPFTDRSNVIGFEVTTSDSESTFLAASINKSTLVDGDSVPSGSYSFRVNQLAQAHQAAVDFAELKTKASEVTFNQGGVSFNVPIGADTSLQDVVTAINQAASTKFDDGEGFRATVLRNQSQEYLVLTSETTGASSVINMNYTASDGSDVTIDNTHVLQQGQDAEVELGEGAIKLTSDSNRLEEAIAGVTLELKQAHGVDEPATRITLGRNPGTLEDKLKELVNKVNSFSDVINNNSTLSRDVGARSIRTQIRSVFREVGVQDGENRFTLRELGLSYDSQGKFQIDSERLQSFLETNPQQVDELLQGENGLFNRLQERTEVFVKRNEGVIDRRQASLVEQREQIDAARERHDRNMNQRFNRYLRELSQMQAAMARFEQTFGVI